MSNCGQTSQRENPFIREKLEFYECDECGFVGQAFEFELADTKGQLCTDCVLESF